MGNIGQDKCTYLIGDLSKLRKIYNARIGRGPGQNHLRFILPGQFFHFGIIYSFIFFAYAVRNNLEIFSRKITGVAVRKMAAAGQIHSQNFIPWFQHGKIYCHIGLGSRMRLDIYMFGSKEFLCPFHCQFLYFIYIFATVIPAFSGVALGVFIGHYRTLSLQHCRMSKILAGN